MNGNSVIGRINEINRLLSDGVSDKLEEERLKNERDVLYSQVFSGPKNKEEEVYTDPLENEYYYEPANDDYLYDYFDDDYENDSELVEINNELERLKNSLKDRVINDSNHVTQEEIQFLLRRIRELESRKRELSNNETVNFEPEIRVNYLEEAKRIVDDIKKLENELNKYYSRELIDNFGVRSSSINRKIDELKEKLEDIKSRITTSELEELENYINSKNDKIDDNIELENDVVDSDIDNNKGNAIPLPAGRNDTMLALPEGTRNLSNNDESHEEEKSNERVEDDNLNTVPLENSKPKRVEKVKKWVNNHKKTLIALGVATLAVGTIALAINLGPAIVAGKMTANAYAWHGASAAMQAQLHSANVALAPELAKTFGTELFAFGPGTWSFSGVALGKVASVAAAKAIASVSAMGLGAGLLAKGLRSSSQEYEHYKKQIKNMNKYYNNEIVKDNDLIYTKDVIEEDIEYDEQHVEDNIEVRNPNMHRISDELEKAEMKKHDEEVSFSEVKNNVSDNVGRIEENLITKKKDDGLRLRFNDEMPEAYNWENDEELGYNSRGRSR